MKKIASKTLPYSFIVLFLAFSLTTTAQNYWKGGTPGAETNWNNPHNWSKNHVPNWTDNVVIIPNNPSGFYPVISKSLENDIPYLEIQNDAQITIAEQGSLIINGVSTYNHGIRNIGSLYNYGKIAILETALSPLTESSNKIINDGVLAINEQIYKSKRILALTE